MKKSKKKERFFMIFFMFIITSLFVAVISSVHLFTKDIVFRNKSLYLKKSVLYTADLKIPERAEQLEKTFKNKVIQKSENDMPYYIVDTENGRIIVLTQNGSGLWGEIIAHIGIQPSDKKLTGIDFIKQSETPGLGARIDETWFKEQFRGKKGPFTFVPEGTDEAKDQFDAITGATVTTKAVKAIVNTGLQRIDNLNKDNKGFE